MGDFNIDTTNNINSKINLLMQQLGLHHLYIQIQDQYTIQIQT